VTNVISVVILEIDTQNRFRYWYANFFYFPSDKEDSDGGS